MIVMKVLQMNT